MIFDEKTKRVQSISCMRSDDKKRSRCIPLFGVSVGDSEEQVIRVLGKPESEKLTGIFKSIRYPALGLELMLGEGRVYLAVKTAPKT